MEGGDIDMGATKNAKMQTQTKSTKYVHATWAAATPIQWQWQGQGHVAYCCIEKVATRRGQQLVGVRESIAQQSRRLSTSNCAVNRTPRFKYAGYKDTIYRIQDTGYWVRDTDLGLNRERERGVGSSQEPQKEITGNH